MWCVVVLFVMSLPFSFYLSLSLFSLFFLFLFFVPLPLHFSHFLFPHSPHFVTSFSTLPLLFFFLIILYISHFTLSSSFSSFPCPKPYHASPTSLLFPLYHFLSPPPLLPLPFHPPFPFPLNLSGLSFTLFFFLLLSLFQYLQAFIFPVQVCVACIQSSSIRLMYVPSASPFSLCHLVYSLKKYIIYGKLDVKSHCPKQKQKK